MPVVTRSQSRLLSSQQDAKSNLPSKQSTTNKDPSTPDDPLPNSLDSSKAPKPKAVKKQRRQSKPPQPKGVKKQPRQSNSRRPKLPRPESRKPKGVKKQPRQSNSRRPKIMPRKHSASSSPGKSTLQQACFNAIERLRLSDLVNLHTQFRNDWYSETMSTISIDSDIAKLKLHNEIPRCLHQSAVETEDLDEDLDDGLDDGLDEDLDEDLDDGLDDGLDEYDEEGSQISEFSVSFPTRFDIQHRNLERSFQ
ncbi:hypothetical protein SBOR_9191 [Sclerotinia borealis F-4128]|uniref:Uncharacterized protein n=1 Tax=Sclerotinia borealis (strain F-4128) TaxID=1432307 RepID=W9C3H8_SCLBF|nr:hypothetical protein SBOR_9191 [Sclerotinia borealis F-4128]